MTISQTLCTSFLQQLMLGVHDFRVGGTGDTFKIALYTANATIGPNTSAYTTSGEVVGANYTAGGITLSNLGTGSDTTSQVAFTNFANAVFTNVSLTARGALIYNTTPSALGPDGALTNPAVCVLDFGADRTVSGQNFVVQFPPNNAVNAIIRIG